MLWSQLASTNNNRWVINTAKDLPPPPDNVVPLDLNLYPLLTTEAPTTLKTFGFKNVDSYFMQQQAATLLENNKPDKVVKESFSDQPKEVNLEMFTPPSGATFHAFGQKKPELQADSVNQWFVRPIKPQGRPSDKWGLSLTKKRIPGGLLTVRKLPLSKEESKGALQDRFTLVRSGFLPVKKLIKK